MITALQAIVGADHVLTGPEDLVAYAYDGTAAMKQRPRAVVFPGSPEEISAIMRWSRDFKIPLVTRGSGTGLSGGSLPTADAVVVATVRLDKVLELDRANLTLLVESGVVTQTIADQAKAAGLFYPPDPGSIKVSTIGGNVAENSGGLRGLKYGVTRDYVLGLEVVLADGSICWMGNKCVKDVAGYNLRDLFIGSEGTLGIITKVLLQLIPAPEGRQTLLATFAQMETAAEAVSAIIRSGVVPCTCEFLDQTTVRCVEDFARVGLPAEAQAVLLIETDGHPAAATAEADKVEAILRAQGATTVRRAQDEREATQLATARRSAFAALARLRPTTILEDVTVPRSQLAGMVTSIQQIATRHRLRVAVFGHFGDGNLHPTILTDERDREEMHRVEEALKEIFAEAIRRGGTITGEHGVGVAKKEYLRQQLGEAAFGVLRSIKAALDPDGRLNPGKVLDV